MILDTCNMHKLNMKECFISLYVFVYRHSQAEHIFISICK